MTIRYAVTESTIKGLQGGYLPIAQFMDLPLIMQDMKINNVNVSVELVDNRRIVFTNKGGITLTNQLMTDENYMTFYTKPQLITILEAKASIYHEINSSSWKTLRDSLPTGYKRLTKAEIVDEIQFYNYAMGVNKAKSEPTMAAIVQEFDEQDAIAAEQVARIKAQKAKRTIKLSRKAYHRMDGWAWLQQYLQDNDRNGEWLSMPPSIDNVLYVLDVLKRWEDDSAWTGYLTRLLKAEPDQAVQPKKWGVMHLDAQGNLDEGNNFYEFTAHNPLKHIKKGIGRVHDFSTGFAIKTFPYNEGTWTKFN